MAGLVESVPNFSEGRRLDVVEHLAAAVESVPGAHLLDRTSDASHNRSVLTIAGEIDAVTEALERAVAVAVNEIDMDAHAGEHPRIGAVDVIPFVPLAGTTIDDCIELARSFGRRIADRFDLPVYLYARAATREDRVKLSDVRRGQYEGLKREISFPGREPDFGPSQMHPSAGPLPSARGRSSLPGTSTCPRRTATWRSGLRAGSGNRAAGCRRSRRTASSSRSSDGRRCR